MSVGKLHHVEINVSDLNRSLKFWGWFLSDLGYKLFQDFEGGQSWKLDDTYLVFVQTQDKYRSKSYHRSHVGLNHLAFYARSREHVDEMTLKLRAKDVNILYPSRHPFAGGPKHYAVFFEDPDRIKVEFVAKDVELI